MSNNQFIITTEKINDYIKYLKIRERAAATIEKYSRDIKAFADFLDGRAATIELAIAWKESITENHEETSVNSMIVSIHGFSIFYGLDIKMKLFKIQPIDFLPAEKELTKQEYERLLHAARANYDERLCYIMQTICATGIRVSELKFITVEAIKTGYAKVKNKGKTRAVFIPKYLRKELFQYIKECGITSGHIFITKNGKPLNRSNIWAEMKKLCKTARVDESKVFPHSLRALFARMYFKVTKDIAKVAAMLGHRHIETTRIYIRENQTEYFRHSESLHLTIGKT